MDTSSMLLVWSVNLLVGAGLLALGMTMRRRPDRLWIGLRIPRSPEDTARVRRTNGIASPLLLILGAGLVASGPLAAALRIPPLTLALAGLGAILLAIASLVAAALLKR